MYTKNVRMCMEKVDLKNICLRKCYSCIYKMFVQFIKTYYYHRVYNIYWENVENLLENGNTGAHEGNVRNTKSIIMPHLEMEFNTREGQEFFDLYLSIESIKQEEEP
mgnify:CR=1 FL=1